MKDETRGKQSEPICGILFQTKKSFSIPIDIYVFQLNNFFFLQTQLLLLSIILVQRTWWSILLNAHPVLLLDGMNQLLMIILVT